MLALAAIPVVGGGAAAAAYFFLPGFAEKLPLHTTHKEEAPPAPPKPTFVDLPEMSVTLPNGGQPRQLRIRISLELVRPPQGLPPTESISPKVYDALLTYLRTLTDREIDSSLAIDRIRGDLYRRLNLILGPDVVQDVLITSLVVA